MSAHFFEALPAHKTHLMKHTFSDDVRFYCYPYSDIGSVTCAANQFGWDQMGSRINGFAKPWGRETMGSRNNGVAKQWSRDQWVRETMEPGPMGSRNNGVAKPWGRETMGSRNNGAGTHGAGTHGFRRGAGARGPAGPGCPGQAAKVRPRSQRAVFAVSQSRGSRKSRLNESWELFD